jgi:hypothetical protein
MMKAAPVAALVMAEADLLLAVLVIAFDHPARLGGVHQALERGRRWQVGQPVFGRLRLAVRPLDEQPFLRPRFSPWAAKRDESAPWLPSRQETARQARLGRLKASALADTGSGPGGRCSRVCGRPRLGRGLGSGGRGAVPGGQTVVVDCTPSTVRRPSSATAARNAVSLP